MTPQQIAIVRDTFELAVPRADELSRVFYDTLFRENPEARALFPDDLVGQRKKLIAALANIVGSITDEEAFMGRVGNLGKRHIWYGAEEAHYDAVGGALLSTLAQLFGPAFTSEVRAAWTAAYTTIATVMKEGARQIRPMLVFPEESVAEDQEPVAEDHAADRNVAQGVT